LRGVSVANHQSDVVADHSRFGHSPATYQRMNSLAAVVIPHLPEIADRQSPAGLAQSPTTVNFSSSPEKSAGPQSRVSALPCQQNPPLGHVQ